MNSFRAWVTCAAILSGGITIYGPEYSIHQSYTSTALVIFLLEFLIYHFYKTFFYTQFFSPLRHLPEPPGGSFFYGHWRTILREPAGSPHRRWINSVPNNGIIRYRVKFNQERILLTSPKAIAEVTVEKSYSFTRTNRVKAVTKHLLGNGLLISEGDEHKYQRKNMLPAFAFRHIKDLYPTFWAKAHELNCCLEEHLKKRAPENSCDISEWARRATLDLIGITTMGHNFNCVRDPYAPLIQTYSRVLNPNPATRIIWATGFLPPKWLTKLLPIKGLDNIREAEQLVRQTALSMVNERKIQLEKSKTLGRPDFISLSLESQSFTDEELVNQIMTLLGSGNDTTSAAFSWAAYALAQHPAIQANLRAEIRNRIPPDTNDIDSAAIDSLPYLRAVINEVLRFYPTIPRIFKVTVQDTSILDQYVPKGTAVVLHPTAINFSTELWGEDAGCFRPERWLEANGGGAKNNYAFMSFSHGPRSCIGQGLARAELSCLVARFVGRFEFTLKDPSEKVETEGPITLKPKGGINILLKVVEGWS